MTLKGKVALVTGGSRGIGAAVVRRLADDGADVAFSYAASADKAERVAADLRDKGVRAVALKADAADVAQVANLVSRVHEQLGRLDILVNNAGIFMMGSLVETTDEDFERAVDVNVKAVFVAAREAAKRMGEGGRIINIGSVIGERVSGPGLGLYAMTKHAIAGLTRGWARDLAPRGITVNAVQPGPIDTDMNPASGEYASFFAGATAFGHYGKVDDIAAAVSFLASPAASYITGSFINVDGGLTT